MFLESENCIWYIGLPVECNENFKEAAVISASQLFNLAGVHLHDKPDT